MRFIVVTLGGAQVEGPSGPLSGRAAHRRRIALLALLAAPPAGSLTREKVIGWLWPECDGERARHRLSVSLSAIRKEMGEDAFVTAGDELSLNPAVVRSDVAEFEAALRGGDARRAVELYRGPFLDGFYVADAQPFEQWVERERDRLARAYADALEGLAEEAGRAGDAEEEVRWRRLAAAHDPWSPRVALRLMDALDAAGDRVAAIRHAAAHAAALREELGIGPDAEVEALASRLRGPSTPEPAAPEAAGREAPAPSSAP
ncbi:MAG TPA: BTAD domain-containing putative transcriptional regulator, partial [Longimicrobiaceae bacterium]|nr:BTAD domain-containing putative transcriptional regulator [Longimicrobiaceae bacterium]